MDTKDLTLKKYVDLAYNNFKDNGYFDDLNNDELTSLLLMESKKILTEISYAKCKNQMTIQGEKIKRLFKNIGILAKINDINLDD